MVDKHFRLKKPLDLSSSIGFQGLKILRLTQNHSKHFFGQTRRGSGSAISITSRNFSSSFQKRWGLLYVNVVANGNFQDVSPIDNILDFSIVDLEYTNDKNHTQWDEFHSLPNPYPSIIDIELRDKDFIMNAGPVRQRICIYFGVFFQTNYSKCI